MSQAKLCVNCVRWRAALASGNGTCHLFPQTTIKHGSDFCSYCLTHEEETRQEEIRVKYQKQADEMAKRWDRVTKKAKR